MGRRIGAALAALLAGGCGGGGDPGVLRLNGRLEAPLVDLAPRVAGRVLEVRVREGDRVKAGDLLVRLDLGEVALAVERDRSALGAAEARLRDLEAGSRSNEIAQARGEVEDREAALALARTSLEREKQLRARSFGAERDFDQARTAVERAEAALRISRDRLRLLQEGAREHQVEQARREVERARAVLAQSETLAAEGELKAPADALVTHRLAEPGGLLAPGQGALTLAFTDRLYARVFVPETALGRVRPGLEARVTVDAWPGREFRARVSQVAPDAEFTPKQVETRAERVNLVYAAKLDLERGWEEPLVPGQPVEATLRLGGETGP